MLFQGASLLDILYTLPAIIIGLSFHEFAHAWVSNRLGDQTPRAQGRLTISPLAHVDPWGMLMLLVFGFGFAKPVMINPNAYKNRRWGTVLVSLAGVTMNLLLAILFTIVMRLLVKFQVIDIYNDNAILNIIEHIIYINIGLMVFNLLPIPPLDGYQAVKQIILHGKTINWLWWLEKYGMIVLIALVYLGATSGIMGWGINHVVDFVWFITGWI